MQLTIATSGKNWTNPFIGVSKADEHIFNASSHLKIIIYLVYF